MIPLDSLLVGCLGFIGLVFLGSKWLEMKKTELTLSHTANMALVKVQEEANYLATEKRRDAALGSRHKPKSGIPSDHPAWLMDLVESLGEDVSILDAAEMPELLASFMPMLNGFIDGGGLDQLKAQAEPAEPGYTEKQIQGAI